ncbi:hypothetical protein Q0590_13765 [Rhodocytophaga aerolata]|uniref:Glycosyltransferase RgtA/B/C/D-like domain-containing protein n=1 Tax=Rhodocytophaga aerolata TaxID=455078 RepID=A0ABT8R5F9_9BACT|nr:hypothetical protein [Rhodocytophaga aerolata]MDO1447330.1 hypothetical protein [Rhodocytophaga aerolata]
MHNKFPKFWLWVIISLGLFLRTFHYLQNRSLYTDEAYLANNLLTRSFLELTQPLDASQHAPILFLFVVKLLMNFLGTSEYVLRLFSFVAGISAFITFFYLLKKYKVITASGIVAGLSIFAFAFPLIYYSSELKQYSVETLCTIICYLLYNRYDRSSSLKDLVVYSLAGATIVWFSYSSIFILASIGITSTIHHLIKKNWPGVFISAIIYGSWAISFFVNYLAIIQPNSLTDAYLVDTWKTAYMPIGIRSVSDIKWFVNSLTAVFDFPLGLNWSFLTGLLHPRLAFSFIGLIFMLIGLYGWFKTNREQLLITCLPILLTLMASSLEKYPFTERFLLFLAPNFILLLAAGVSTTESYIIQHRYKKKWIYIAIVILLFPMCTTAVTDVIHHQKFGGWKRREMKEVITYLGNSKQPTDYIFLYHTASAFDYYYRIYKLDWPYYTILDKEFTKADIQQKLKQHNADTFWVVIPGTMRTDINTLPYDVLNDKEIFLRFFNDNFKRIKDFKTTNIYTIQYKLNNISQVNSLSRDTE